METQKEEIAALYKGLVRQEFSGTYNGNDGKWDRIDLAAGDPLGTKLAAIQKVAQGKVWKGFTNDQDSDSGFSWNYRLFVRLNLAGIPNPTKFRITDSTRFDMSSGSSYELRVGFPLNVTAIST